MVAAVVAVVALTAGCLGREDERGSRGANVASDAQGADVVAVIDGDTIDVVIEGRRERVRLIGVNAPERDECFSADASAALQALVAGERVRLVADVSDRDDYDRLLRYVEVGEVFVNEELVAGGFAISRRYEPDTARQDVLDRAQERAERARRGQWAAAACGEAAPGTAALEIVDVQSDPPGDDTLVLNEEFVVIGNEGDRPVRLSGWVLRDESASHRFAFPSGFELGPGAEVTVHTGCGEPTATDLYWCVAGSAVWNNDGDTVFLVDPSGNLAVTRPVEAS